MLRNVRTCRYSQLFTALGLLLVLNLNLMGAYGPYLGKGRFVGVGPAAVKMSPSGYGVLVLSDSEVPQRRNLRRLYRQTTLRANSSHGERLRPSSSSGWVHGGAPSFLEPTWPSA